VERPSKHLDRIGAGRSFHARYVRTRMDVSALTMAQDLVGCPGSVILGGRDV
jgi:hypothetical protein